MKRTDAQNRINVIALVGPTASGKTALSLALAQHLGAEVIACDSRTVYRKFDIGTAKPTAEEQRLVRHHAIDVADAEIDYTAAQFAQDGTKAIKDIHNRGLTPLVAGGTGFYARALLEGLVIPAVPPQEQLRLELKTIAEKQGCEALHKRLFEVDPLTAARLGVNDRFRIIRALEVHAVTGIPISQAARREEPPCNTLWIGLTVENRAVLHAAIKKRFEEQMEAGLLAETQSLYKRYGPHQKLMHTVNYRELVQLIEGSLDQKTAYEQAVSHNIKLARRQLIWFRANAQITWFAIDTLTKAQLTQAVLTHIKDRLA